MDLKIENTYKEKMRIEIPEKNVGGLDKKFRYTFGIILIILGILLLIGFLGDQIGILAGILSLLAGFGLLFNAVTGFCGLNYILGLNTCKADNKNKK